MILSKCCDFYVISYSIPTDELQQSFKIFSFLKTYYMRNWNLDRLSPAGFKNNYPSIFSPLLLCLLNLAPLHPSLLLSFKVTVAIQKI